MVKYIYLIASILLFVSCEDFLDQNPDSRADLNSPENISALLTSAYPIYTHIWFTEVMSDNATDVGPEAATDIKSKEQSYYWSTVDGESQDTPDGYWYSCYEAIAACNTALEAIAKLENEQTYSSSELNPFKGEALMCRAYAHFMLVNLFAEHYDPATASSEPGIPFVTSVETSPLVEYTRQSVEDVYSAIQSDFQKGFPLISDDKYDATKWHFNKQAAATFISRYYLYRGLNTDWDSVVYYSNIALQNNPQGYLRDWLTTYDKSFQVFGKNYSKSDVPANYLIQSNVTTSQRAWYNRYTMDIELVRKRVVYGTPHPTKTDVTNDFVFINKAGGSSTLGCYGIFKFNEEFKRSGINANSGIPYVMHTSFVAEEALFNLMEGYVISENYDQVIDLLNLYYSTRIVNYNAVDHEVTNERILAIYSDTFTSPDINPHFILNEKQKTYLKCIINIRATEFISEGYRWFDIKRMHIQIEHPVYNGEPIILTPNDERRVINFPEYVGDLESGPLGNSPNIPESNSITPIPYSRLFDITSIEKITSLN